MRQCTNAPQLRLAEEREQGLRVALMRAQQEREQAVPERDAAPDSAKLRRRRGSSGRPSPRPKETPLSAAPPSQLPRAGGDAALAVALRRLLAGGQTSEAISLFLARQRRRPGGALQLWVESMPHAVANVDKGGAVITPLR